MWEMWGPRASGVESRLSTLAHPSLACDADSHRRWTAALRPQSPRARHRAAWARPSATALDARGRVHADFLVRPDARGERLPAAPLPPSARRRRRRRARRARCGSPASTSSPPPTSPPASARRSRGRAPRPSQVAAGRARSRARRRAARSEPPVRSTSAPHAFSPSASCSRAVLEPHPERRRRAGRRDAGQGPHRPHPGEPPRLEGRRRRLRPGPRRPHPRPLARAARR